MTRIVTQLDPRCITYRQRLEVCARELGEPLIPMQLEAAELINAVDPDRPDHWRYPLVVITVPRQTGKSTLLRAVHLDRLIRPLPTGYPAAPTTIWTTAQRGKDARRRFNDLANRIKTSKALGQLISHRASVGSEALTFGRVSLSPFAPVADALHGETSPFISVDEAWAFDELRAATLLAAITPTQQNVPGSQLVVVSTAGTHQSRWLWSLVKAGRESVHDPKSRIGYVEYSADPRFADDGDLDPLDPVALDFHPGIDGGITTREDIAALYPKAGGTENIRRGFLNLWPSDMDHVASRDMDLYDKQIIDLDTTDREAVYAFDVANDRSGAAIYAATTSPDGTRHIELVKSAPGAAWLATDPTLQTNPAWYDPAGYTAIAAREITAQEATYQDLAAATADLLAGISDGTITIDATPELREQYEYAITRPAGAGFVFDVRKSPGPIDHLRAAAMAAYKRADTNTIPLIAW